MKNILIVQLIIHIWFLNTINAQSNMDSWRIFSPNEKVIGIEHQGSMIYTAFELGILTYDVDYKEQSLWTNANHLSDFRISALGKHEPTNTIIIGYDNGNIDLIQNEQVYNIPGIKLASIQGIKSITKITSHEQYVYVNTGFGIVIVDPKRKEIKDTYYPSSTEEIMSSQIIGDTLYALTTTRLLKCNKNNPAISNTAYWSVDSTTKLLTLPAQGQYIDMIKWQNELLIVQKTPQYAFDTIYRRRTNSFTPWMDKGGYLEYGGMVVRNNILYCMGMNFIEGFDSWNTINFFFNDYTFGTSFANSLDLVNDNIYIGDNNFGLIHREVDGKLNRISFQGPYRSEAYAMDWYKGKMAIAPGNNGEISPTYTTVGLMIFKDQKWTYVKDSHPLWTGKYIWDNGAVAINPINEEIAVGTLSQLPVSIINKEGELVDTFSKYNSTLAPYTQNNQGWYYINDLTYDSKGNLWIINSNTSDILKLKEPNGTWSKFNLGYSSAGRSARKIYADYFDNIWVVMKGNGVIGYKPGSNVQSTSDDKRIHLNSANELGEMWPSSNVSAITMDYDNELWIGTDKGFCILYNSNEAFEKTPGSYKVQRPKISTQQVGDDEFSETQYVLGYTSITDIEVDGGNRKWMGTISGGAILLSADGQQVIKHFTTENSPLLSNNILDIEIDHYTGEVFFATERGLITYRSDASHEDPEYTDVKVFPNPAYPDFNGVITIQGISYDSDINVTDIAGNVVYKTTSNGGTATWNGCDFDGNKVATGVYLFWTASNAKKGKFVGKVAILN